MDPFMLAAFPKALGAEVRRASEGLESAMHLAGGRLIQDSYERRWGRIIVDGDELEIPYRHYQQPIAPIANPEAELVRQAWLTRSARGRVRQQAVQSQPRDSSMLDAYQRFWRDNPDFVTLTYARAASYWDVYYRRTLTLDEYPPPVAMAQVETLVKS